MASWHTSTQEPAALGHYERPLVGDYFLGPLPGGDGWFFRRDLSGPAKPVRHPHQGATHFAVQPCPTSPEGGLGQAGTWYNVFLPIAPSAVYRQIRVRRDLDARLRAAAGAFPDLSPYHVVPRVQQQNAFGTDSAMHQYGYIILPLCLWGVSMTVAIHLVRRCAGLGSIPFSSTEYSLLAASLVGRARPDHLHFDKAAGPVKRGDVGSSKPGLPQSRQGKHAPKAVAQAAGRSSGLKIASCHEPGFNLNKFILTRGHLKPFGKGMSAWDRKETVLNAWPPALPCRGITATCLCPRESLTM